MNGRRIKLKYSKVDIDKLSDWLDSNKYIHSYIPDTSQYGTIEDLSLFLEVYTEEAETAVRLKWETE